MLGHVLHDVSDEDTEAWPCMHPIVLLALFWPVIFTRPTMTHMHTLTRFSNYLGNGVLRGNFFTEY